MQRRREVKQWVILHPGVNNEKHERVLSCTLARDFILCTLDHTGSPGEQVRLLRPRSCAAAWGSLGVG